MDERGVPMSAAGLERHPVAVTDRIRVTGRLVREAGARRVLEVGAGDHSFRPWGLRDAAWTTADMAPPCDVLCEFNAPDARLPFADAGFELAVCTQVLEHLLWPQRLLAELHRVLVPGGRLVASVPNAASLTYRVSWALGRLPSCAASGNLPGELGGTGYRGADGTMVGGHVVDFTAARLSALLRACGFAVRARHGSGLNRGRRLLPPWLVPVSLASDLIFLADRP